MSAYFTTVLLRNIHNKNIIYSLHLYTSEKVTFCSWETFNFQQNDRKRDIDRKQVFKTLINNGRWGRYYWNQNTWAVIDFLSLTLNFFLNEKNRILPHFFAFSWHPTKTWALRIFGHRMSSTAKWQFLIWILKPII